MKKIINGKSYDTETAREIASDSPDGYAVNDFHYYSETLYCKRTGEYFIYGEGNAESKYAEPYGNSSWVPGERIMPLSYDEATKWAEEHMDADDYEKEFGVVDDESEKVLVGIRLTPKAKTLLDRSASEQGKSKSAVVEELVTSHVMVNSL